ncbi:MAG: hypothetical protein FDZ70_10450, partial [Actinobacteria bacterium]
MSATKKSVPPEPIGGDKAELGQRALKDKKLLKQLVAALSGEDRAQRSLAAEVLHDVACSEPRLLQPHGTEFIDALLRPEARTRWETLDVLTEMVAVDTRLVEKALSDAIECMHDEESSVVRTSACRMLAAWGATTETRAAKIWPLLAEASRAYHGDPEYGPMLAGVVTLVEGAAGDEVKWAAAELFENDVTDPDRGVARRAKRIAQLRPKRKPAKGAKPKAVPA